MVRESKHIYCNVYNQTPALTTMKPVGIGLESLVRSLSETEK